MNPPSDLWLIYQPAPDRFVVRRRVIRRDGTAGAEIELGEASCLIGARVLMPYGTKRHKPTATEHDEVVEVWVREAVA